MTGTPLKIEEVWTLVYVAWIIIAILSYIIYLYRMGYMVAPPPTTKSGYIGNNYNTTGNYGTSLNRNAVDRDDVNGAASDANTLLGAVSAPVSSCYSTLTNLHNKHMASGQSTDNGSSSLESYGYNDADDTTDPQSSEIGRAHV